MRPVEDIRRRFLWALLATVCFSMLANGYSYFNFYPIHDAVDFVIGGPWGPWQTQLGRFLVPVYMRLKGSISMPWLTGVISMLYLGASVFIVTELLGQTSRLGIVLVSGFLSANLFTLETNSAQQYFSDVFLLALLFACLGVYLAWRGRGARSMLAAGLCMFVSFGLYQAFVTFAACLCVLAALRELVQGEGFSKPVIRRLLACAAVMAAAGVLYLAVGRVVLRAIDREPSDVQWSIFTADERGAGQLWTAVLDNYRRFFLVFFDGEGYVGRLFGVFTGLLAVIAAVTLVRALWKRKLALLLIAALAALFPLASRLVNVFTNIPGAFRTMYAQFLLWPALVCLIFWRLPEAGRRRTALVATTAALSLAIILGNVRYNNGAFTVQRIMNERALYHVGRVMEDLEAYDPEKEIALWGTFDFDTPDEGLLQRYEHINGFTLSTGADSALAFVRYANLLGYSVNWNPFLVDEIRLLPEARAMPAYPQEGYIKEMDDCIVVRLREAGPRKSKVRQAQAAAK